MIPNNPDSLIRFLQNTLGRPDFFLNAPQCPLNLSEFLFPQKTKFLPLSEDFPKKERSISPTIKLGIFLC